MITTKALAILSTAHEKAKREGLLLSDAIKDVLRETTSLTIKNVDSELGKIVEKLEMKYGYVDTDTLREHFSVGVWPIEAFAHPVFADVNIASVRAYVPSFYPRLKERAMEKGAKILIVGREGSGKTTLLRLLAHDLRSTNPIMFRMGSLPYMDPTSLNLPQLLDDLAPIEASGTTIMCEAEGIKEIEDRYQKGSYSSKLLVKKILNLKNRIIVTTKPEDLPLLRELFDGETFDLDELYTDEDRRNIIAAMIDVELLAAPEIAERIIDTGEPHKVREAADALAKTTYSFSKVQDILYKLRTRERVSVSTTFDESMRNRIEKLEDNLKSVIIGQDESIREAVDAIKKNLVLRTERPLASILMSGPTGVGKTETARQLARFLYGSESAFMRIDMGEFGEAHTISSLLGSPPGYVGYAAMTPLEKFLRERGKAGGVLLFDELEKAHESVRAVLLALLDNGTLTMRHGTQYRLNNYIIMATTNAPVTSRVMSFTDKTVYDKKKLYNSYRPELINRFDVVLVYKELSENILREIARRKLDMYINQILRNHTVEISYDTSVIDGIIENLFDKNGRAVVLTIQNKILPKVGDAIVKGSKKIKIVYDKEFVIKEEGK